MDKNITSVILCGLLTVLASGCWYGEPWNDFREAYYEPIYGEVDLTLATRQEAPRPLKNPGRIYVKDNMLLIVEQHEGIHIIDNTQPDEPMPKAFVAVPGATNLAVYGQYLYTNNQSDLVTLDISNLAQVREVNRIPDALEPFAQYPPFTNVSFECVDPAKGLVVGWREAEWPDEEPKCRR